MPQPPAAIDYTLHYRTWHDNSDADTAAKVAAARHRLQSLLPLPPQGTLLDIGCGTGFSLAAVAQLGYAAFGIDLDSGQIAECRRRGLPAAQVSDTSTFLASHPAEYSVILLFDVLEHIPVAEQILILSAIRAAMRPGGKIIVQTPNANSPLASRYRYIDYTHHCSFTEHSLRFVMLSAGFERFGLEPEPPLRRPSLRLYRRDARRGLTRWFCRWLWRQMLDSELGDFESVAQIPVGVNLLATAFNPG